MTFEQKQQEAAAMPTITLIYRMENLHLFENEGGGIANCVEWIELKARLAAAEPTPPSASPPTSSASSR